MEKLHQDVGEIKGKLDSLIAMYTDDRKRLDAVQKKVLVRLRHRGGACVPGDEGAVPDAVMLGRQTCSPHGV
jgi:hypothetical protein